MPTEAAKAFMADVGPSLAAVRDAVGTAGQTERRPELRLLVAPSLAAEWLLPQLAACLADAGIGPVALCPGEAGCTLDPAAHDIAIVASPEADDGRSFDTLLPLHAAVVAAPVLADQRRPPSQPDAVREHDRLDLRFPDSLWRRWSERSGEPMPRDRHAGRFSSVVTMYEAAASGFGVALATPLVAERRLREGSLRPCFRGLTPLGYDYRVVYRDARTRARPDIQRWVATLRERADNSHREFRALAA